MRPCGDATCEIAPELLTMFTDRFPTLCENGTVSAAGLDKLVVAVSALSSR